MSLQSLLTPQDFAYIAHSGRDRAQVEQQLMRFQQGFLSLKLVQAVSPDNGMHQLDEARQAKLVSTFAAYAQTSKGFKFVPASGAASRMFRNLFAGWSREAPKQDQVQKDVETFVRELERFAFFPQLVVSLQTRGLDLSTLRAQGDTHTLFTHVLGEGYLELGSLAKGLIPFHAYDGYAHTALEEHLQETALYASSRNREAHLHITVSPQHRLKIESSLQAPIPALEAQFGLTLFLTTSLQQPATDTLAVDLDNRPFRQPDGQLLFRPGGHGALLENLNQLDADWVFIKNVDNVVPTTRVAPTAHWNQVMGGLLAETQGRIHAELRKLDALAEADKAEAEASLRDFVEQELFVGLPDSYASLPLEEKLACLRTKLDRPLRVVGCIRTDQQTGGGPFWVAGADGSQSLQLVESAQVDPDSPVQQAIALQAGYANITFLICGMKNYRGEPFDLRKYRDEDTGFIVQKSANGRPLKALELPGLWNGAMANWNTLLVEVPQTVFNPVKSVLDLLGPMHQG